MRNPTMRTPPCTHPLPQGPPEWIGMYYQYKITVYCPWTQRVETSYATDPYSRSLAANSSRTHILDIRDDAYKPPGWDTHRSPGLQSWTDISVYELHVRDFSACDDSVSQHVRGKYLAFAEAQSLGVERLRELAQAGITHVHLLPSYDFGSVPERPEEQRWPEVGGGWGCWGVLHSNTHTHVCSILHSHVYACVLYLALTRVCMCDLSCTHTHTHTHVTYLLHTTG